MRRRPIHRRGRRHAGRGRRCRSSLVATYEIEGDRMKAIVQDRYGPADVLRLEDIEEPVAGADEVLVRVLAASAFIGDWHIATGLPYAIRAVSGLRAPKNRVRGQDLAGRVEGSWRAGHAVPAR